jgi:hypothetical protein
MLKLFHHTFPLWFCMVLSLDIHQVIPIEEALEELLRAMRYSLIQ